MGNTILILGLAAVTAFGQVPDTLPATITHRISSPSDTGPASFGRVEAVELGAEGSVFVLDGLAHELRAFGADGSHTWTVGRKGEGPGEFLSPFGLTIAKDGDLWVIDPENQRATVVTPSGQLSATHHLPGGMALSPWPGRFDAVGNLYSYTPDPTEGYEFRIVRYDDRLRPAAMLTPPTEQLGEFFEGRTLRGSHMRTRVPFTARLIWRIDSQGRFVWVRTNTVRFMRRSARGNETVLGALRSEGPLVTTEEVQDALEGLKSFEERGGDVDRSRIPETKPPVQTFVLDEYDRIWSISASASGVSHSLAEVFDSDGLHLATVLLPFRIESVPTPVIRGARIVGVERNEFGVDQVVVAVLPTLPN